MTVQTFMHRFMATEILAIAIFLLVPVAVSAHQDSDDTTSIDDTPLVTTPDLLRGFSNAELANVQKLIPQRPEPPLAEATPRIATIQGRVFLDANGNGKLESNEKGIAAITVSDGQRLERTMNDGTFTFVLRFDDKPHHRFITLTRPNGYRLTNEFFVRIPYNDNRVEYSMNFGLQAAPKSPREISGLSLQVTANFLIATR